MQRRRVRWAAWLVPGTAALALGLLAPPPSGAQAPIPVGGQFQVNTYTTSFQDLPSVATDVSGNFVVVWESYRSSGTDTAGFSIQGQRYASNGSTQGTQFQVNTYTTNGQSVPSVAMEPDGDFVVVWGNYPSFGPNIKGQRYSSNGSARGAEFQINTSGTDIPDRTSVAVAADGDFVVAWSYFLGAHAMGRRFASNGSPLGAQFQINTDTTWDHGSPFVASAADGDFIVAWAQQSPNRVIYAKRYASNGSQQGAEFQVSTYLAGPQSYPSVAIAASEDFFVVWDSDGSVGSDTSETSIQGQRYASNGSAQGTQFQVNSYTTSYQYFPSVAPDGAGGFAVVWGSGGSFGSDTSQFSIQGQRHASDGSAQGTQFQVNSYTTSYQSRPSVAPDGAGGFVVVWASSGSFGTDSSSKSIQGQRFSVPSFVPALSGGTRSALGAVLLLLGAAFALRRRF